MNAVAFTTPVALVVGLPSAAADLCSIRLTRAGYHVARAAHGPAACDLAPTLRPSVIVISPSLWALERRAVESAAAAIHADVIEAGDLHRLLVP